MSVWGHNRTQGTSAARAQRPELLGHLAAENDACRGHRYPANTQTFRSPRVARVGRTVRPCSAIEDAPRLRACREAARRPIARLFERRPYVIR
jgi:hypothetical protein